MCLDPCLTDALLGPPSAAGSAPRPSRRLRLICTPYPWDSSPSSLPSTSGSVTTSRLPPAPRQDPPATDTPSLEALPPPNASPDDDDDDDDMMMMMMVMMTTMVVMMMTMMMMTMMVVMMIMMRMRMRMVRMVMHLCLNHQQPPPPLPLGTSPCLLHVSSASSDCISLD